SHPPNSSGVVALELLGLLGRLDPPGPDTFGPHGCSDPAWLHRAIEAAKLALVDRERWLGDPAFVDVPVERLLDPVALAALVARIDPRRADPAPPPVATLVGGTVYLAVVDAAGDVVSLIESNASGFGSGVVDPVTGIHLQNRGASFSLVPGHPNVLAPGKRPAHTLLPGLLLRDGRPWVVVGSMGGDAQPQIHAQVVSALVDGRLDVATAVTAPRWFVRPSGPFGPPVSVAAEPRFGAGVLEALEGLGHPVERVRPFDSLLGHCHAIELVGGGPAVEGGSLAAATDPRSAGLPAVR
ncbi:MAG TPA: gamma-glutamyltransferase, partial [Candidatus Limnocylindrales bacterium]|nr:gamma-glutamyltransferase [Candidatus Limnocylindrales bacterium]